MPIKISWTVDAGPLGTLFVYRYLFACVDEMWLFQRYHDPFQAKADWEERQ